MNTKIFNPWNWFAHEEQQHSENRNLPVKQGDFIPSQHPRSNMMQLHHEIDRLFNNAFSGFPSFSHSPLWNEMIDDEFMPTFQANLNIASEDGHYTITLDAPGMERKDVSIELTGRTLLVKGNKEKEQKEENKHKHYFRIERHYGSFERVLAIPDDAIVEEINANMKNGVLTISIPRREVAKAEVKKITIDS